jgi:hypothetical protein
MWNGSKVVAELHAARTKVGFARGEVATMNSAKTFSDASVSRQAGLYVAGLVFLTLLGSGGLYAAWQPVPVADDPLVRMPGTQPEEGVNVEAPNRCLNCHAGYNEGAEPGYNWIGSMMAQAARDPIFWACLTVAAQDSIHVLGNPNATDLCLRCHFPGGWLGGRSDPTNASAMTGSDFDGLHCDTCHRMWDPFFETTHAGTREGNDWTGYWDESSNLSQSEAYATYLEDRTLAGGTRLFNGGDFFVNNEPQYSYQENGSGQYFMSPNSQKRASFADAEARHQMLYSRTHKSKYFCGTCHDVSNPVLANLGLDPSLPDQSGGTHLITEQYSAYQYFHVERTFSEFMLSAYGQPGGAATNPAFQAQGAPDITWASKCQDCHMRDVRGAGCNKRGAPVRPEQSAEHPNSGLPLHDLTGGNSWIPYILATLDPSGPVYDQTNVDLLDQGPAVLTLDLNAGQSPKENGAALLAGSERAKQQLRLAATIQNLTYNASNGALSFRVQNNTGHKLISGFPEGRRMFLNIKAYANASLIYEVNPYDYAVGTLKGFPGTALGPNEVYMDALVYEVHPSSLDITGEEQTFHFVLATSRSKDNRIPPKGFDISRAAERISQPVWHGAPDPAYFSGEEYAGGYDDVSLSIAPNATQVEVTLYYQGTSREYIEFLRDEINGTGNLTLPAEAYIIQTDPFFSQLKAWGNTIWELWRHNHGLDGSGKEVAGIVPFAMTEATWGQGAQPCGAPTPSLLSAVPHSGQVELTWSDEHSGDPNVQGYDIYYDQAGKSQLLTQVGLITTYRDTALTNGQTYSYKVTSRYVECESDFSNILAATPGAQGQLEAGVTAIETGTYVTTGKGKNKTVTLELRTIFSAGEAILIRVYVADQNGLPLSNSVVEITLSGPETTTLTTGPSDSNGVAEVTWQTQAPNKRGRGGTTPGLYTATTTNVVAEGYTWNGAMASTTFSLE